MNTMLKLFVHTLLFTPIASTVFAAGSYPISSCEDLANIADSDGQYYLVNAIDCTEMKSFAPIPGTFSGILNGNHHTISNLTINQGQNGTGLFEQIVGRDEVYDPATIQNINFENVLIVGTSTFNSNTGLIAGSAHEARIENINVKNLTISGTDQIKGGILGLASNLTLSNVQLHTTINIAQNQYVGGLIGNSQYNVKIVQASVNPLTVNYAACKYESCAVGGLIGITTSSTQIQLPTTISRSFAAGRISTDKNGGGLIGLIDHQSYVNIDNSYAIVEISTKKFAGGLIGQASEENNRRGNVVMTHVYTAGKVVGHNKQCDVLPPNGSGHCAKRGVLGNQDKSTPRVKSAGSFFDKQTSDKEYSGASYTDLNNNQTYEPEAKKTSEMKTAQTFKAAGWDESIWKLEDGFYPVLK